ncbi:MAG: hypothetical protein OEV44_01325 [Spirochaetota bacterium]|nr:hypothetical protein [Spirochaetota bacterium]
MKYKIVIILIILISINSYAENFEYDINIGYNLEYSIYKTNIQMDYEFKFINLDIIPFFDYINYMEFEYTNLKGIPFLDIYKVGINFKIKTGLYIIASHYCKHPIVSYNIDFIRIEEMKKDIGSGTYLTVGYTNK